MKRRRGYHNRIPRASSIFNPRSAILLAVLVLATLGRLCTHEFVQLDDPHTIANNPAFNPPNLARIAKYWAKPAEALYVPLTYSVWGALAFVAHVNQADESGSTLNPWVYHSANVLIHLITTLLVYTILKRLTRHEWASIIGAAIFAVHPVQVETVAWASGTKDLLCGVFIVASIEAMIRYRVNANRSVLIWMHIATLLACLSKPTGIVAPLMCLTIDVLFLGNSFRRSIAALWISIGVACVFAVIGKLVQPPVMADAPALLMRPLIATDALAFYLLKLSFPLHLAPDYGRMPRIAIARGWIWWTWITPLLLAIVLWSTRRRWRGIFAGALIALIGVAPVLGLIPFTFQAYSTVADHYLYPSMLGISLIVASLLSLGKPYRISIAGSIVVVLATLSFIFAGFWSNTQTLFTHTLEVNPRSFLAYTNRAVDHVHRDEFDQAYDDLRHAVEINPDYAYAHLNLANLLLQQNDLAGAVAEAREVLRIYSMQRNFDPKRASSSAADIATMLAQRGEYAQAAQILQDALEHDPGNQRLSQLLAAMHSRAATKP